MTKHFLVVNENGSDNIGDHAINEGLKSLLNHQGYSYEEAPFSTRPVAPVRANFATDRSLTSIIKSKILSIKPLYHLLWYLKNKGWINTELKKSKFDALIIGGGQLVLSGYAFPIAMYTWVKCAKALDVPVNIVGVGCGERFLPSEIFLYKKSLSQCNNIFVREQASIEKVNRFFCVKANFCPDLAFGLIPMPEVIKREGIVVGMTDYAVFQRYNKEVVSQRITSYVMYLDFWAKRVIAILQDETETVYLASTTYKDAQCNCDLLVVLQQKITNPIVLIDGVEPLESYRLLLAKTRIVLSARMHSLILAKIEGSEIEPWVISAKIKGFLAEYGEFRVNNLRSELKFKVFENI